MHHGKEQDLHGAYDSKHQELNRLSTLQVEEASLGEEAPSIRKDTSKDKGSLMASLSGLRSQDPHKLKGKPKVIMKFKSVKARELPTKLPPKGEDVVVEELSQQKFASILSLLVGD